MAHCLPSWSQLWDTGRYVHSADIGDVYMYLNMSGSLEFRYLDNRVFLFSNLWESLISFRCEVAIKDLRE